MLIRDMPKDPVTNRDAECSQTSRVYYYYLTCTLHSLSSTCLSLVVASTIWQIQAYRQPSTSELTVASPSASSDMPCCYHTIGSLSYRPVATMQSEVALETIWLRSHPIINRPDTWPVSVPCSIVLLRKLLRFCFAL